MGVDRVFGLPGVQNVELFDALADAPFATFTPTNESAAVFMADAYARVTGKLGVAVVIAGPGLTNALTGIAEAHLDSSPVLVLVGASGEVAGKSFQLHHIEQGAVVAPLVKGCFKPASVEEVPGTILRAAELARQGEPGPVVVEIPSTLLMERRVRFTPSAAPPPAAVPDVSGLLDDAAERLRRSSAIGIYAGAGAAGAAEELRAACRTAAGSSGYDDLRPRRPRQRIIRSAWVTVSGAVARLPPGECSAKCQPCWRWAANTARRPLALMEPTLPATISISTLTPRLWEQIIRRRSRLPPTRRWLWAACWRAWKRTSVPPMHRCTSSSAKPARGRRRRPRMRGPPPHA